MAVDADARVVSPEAERRWELWDSRSTPILIVAAVLSVAGAAEAGPADSATAVLEVACWSVFLVDLVVRMRLRPGYLGTRRGRIDLAVVLLTVPWYLLVAGGTNATVLGAVRLTRLVRIVVASARGLRRLRQLAERLSKATVYLFAVVTVCSVVVQRAEPPEAGFADLADALWWAVVTVTTVGYGDLVPTTALGRLAAAALMFAGLAFLGTLAGSLASYLRVDDDARPGPGSERPATQAGSDRAELPSPDLVAEVRALRIEVAALREAVERGATAS
jgi:voltage-gated potassium channel